MGRSRRVIDRPIFRMALLLFPALAGCFYSVHQTEQVIITQFGKPVGDPTTEPGLHFKVPFIQEVNRIDKRFLEWDGSPVAIPTRDKTYIHGDPSDSDRYSAYFSVAALYNITNTIQLSGFTRPEYQHYPHDPLGSRDDVNVTVGASVSWTPNQYVSVGATASYIGNFSTQDERRYDVVTPSFILGAQFAF